MIVRDNSDKESLRLDYKNDGNLFDVAGNLYKGGITIARGIQGAINQARSSDEGFDKMLGELESSNNTHEWTNNNPNATTKLSDNRDAGTIDNSTITQYAPVSELVR